MPDRRAAQGAPDGSGRFVQSYRKNARYPPHAASTILYFTRYTTNLRQQQIETTAWARDYSKWYAEQSAALNTYAWADAAAGTVRVPIDVARNRVVAKYAGSGR